jgi:hypothetical protein
MAKGFNYAATIAALLARANHPNTPAAEADQARAMAETWMRKYRIAESEALAEDPTSATPEMVQIRLTVHSTDLSHHLISVAQACAEHAEVRIKMKWDYEGTGYALVVTVVGYEGDLRYFELLWTNAHLMFSTRITPVWSADRSVEENIFYMRQAGIKRREIAFAAGWDGDNAASRSRVQRVYLKAARDRGETANATGLGFDSKNYRQAYAEQFVLTLKREMRRAREAASSGVPAVFGRAEAVEKAFYDFCPEMKPSTEVAEPYVAPNANCDRCKRAASGFCREHNYLKPRTWTAADERRWQQQQYGQSARAGRESGDRAARGVVVSRGAATARPAHVEAANVALEG